MAEDKPWNPSSQRILLLQIIALKNMKMFKKDWKLIAQNWNDGRNPDSFRVEFERMKLLGIELIQKAGPGEHDFGGQGQMKGVPYCHNY